MCCGAPSINIWTVSRVTRHPLIMTKIDTRILAIASAAVHPKNLISNAAIIAPTDPNKSPNTCRKALLKFKFPFTSPASH